MLISVCPLQQSQRRDKQPMPEAAMSHVARKVIRFSAILMFMTAAGCFGQFSGSVQGTVQDANGLAVTNAKVTLTNTDTTVSRQATSDSSGLFRFVSLAPGPYEISATQSGFGVAKVSFTLTSNETRDVRIVLAVSKVATTAEVTSQAPLLDTADSRNEQTLEVQALQDLPLVARNPTALITLTPGVTG